MTKGKIILLLNSGIISFLILMNGCAHVSSQSSRPDTSKIPEAVTRIKALDANQGEVPQINQEEISEINQKASDEIQSWVQLLRNENKAVRDQARESLIKAGSAAIPALADLLKSTSDFIPCWEAVNIMGCIADAKASPYLVEQSLRSTDHHVRWRSIWALGTMPQEMILPPLIDALKGQDERIRWNAAVALSSFYRPEAIPVLKHGLTNHSSWIQWEAINALGRVYDQETVPALVSLLGCSICTNKNNQQEAILSLAKIGDSRATPALINALTDGIPGIRWRAAMALGNIKDASALPALKKCLETEHDELVINSVKKAIEKINDHQAHQSTGQEEVFSQETERASVNIP
ncbi:MAG: HEAT repeat domain-containing protein [bacterium]